MLYYSVGGCSKQKSTIVAKLGFTHMSQTWEVSSDTCMLYLIVIPYMIESL